MINNLSTNSPLTVVKITVEQSTILTGSRKNIMLISLSGGIVLHYSSILCSTTLSVCWKLTPLLIWASLFVIFTGKLKNYIKNRSVVAMVGPSLFTEDRVYQQQ